jgi:hypothetical protein
VAALAKPAAKSEPEKVVASAVAKAEQLSSPEKPKLADVAQPIAQRPQLELTLAADVPAMAQKSEPVASPLGRLAKALATAAVPPTPASPQSREPVRAEAKPIVANKQTTPAAASDAKRPQPVSFGTKTNTERPVASDVKAPATATASMTAALEKWNSSFDLGELSLMATGVWAATPSSKQKAKDPNTDELSGAEALSLISEPAEQTIASTDPTLKLETLAEPETEPKLAANAQ